MQITSRQNPRVKQTAALRERAARDAQQRIIIDGVREISRALGAGVAMQEAWICPALCRTPESQTLAARLQQSVAENFEVTPEVFAKLAYGERAPGVLAVAATPATSLATLQPRPQPGEAPLVVVLEAVEKPGNLGAVLRTADGAGASAVIVADPRTDLFNPNAIRASLGTIFTLPLASATAEECRAWLSTGGYQVLAAQPDAPQAYPACDCRGATALVLGSEAEGLTPAWRDARPVSIPMLGAADSLNVSIAAAILLYEARRQRS